VFLSICVFVLCVPCSFSSYLGVRYRVRSPESFSDGQVQRLEQMQWSWFNRKYKELLVLTCVRVVEVSVLCPRAHSSGGFQQSVLACTAYDQFYTGQRIAWIHTKAIIALHHNYLSFGSPPAATETAGEETRAQTLPWPQHD
jgi:hypothetical protein